MSFLGLDGKVVLITGTGRGQGRVAAEAFAAEGAVVVGGDVAPGPGDAQLDATGRGRICGPHTA
ncbi:MAG TPA: hypothetical protein VF066_16665 [Thermoleophilaceae bacterium]